MVPNSLTVQPLQSLSAKSNAFSSFACSAAVNTGGGVGGVGGRTSSAASPPSASSTVSFLGTTTRQCQIERKALIATCFRRRRAPTADATRLLGSNPQETTAQHSTAHYTRLYLQRCCISSIVLQYRLQGMGGGRGGRGGRRARRARARGERYGGFQRAHIPYTQHRVRGTERERKEEKIIITSKLKPVSPSAEASTGAISDKVGGATSSPEGAASSDILLTVPKIGKSYRQAVRLAELKQNYKLGSP